MRFFQYARGESGFVGIKHLPFHLVENLILNPKVKVFLENPIFDFRFMCFLQIFISFSAF